MPPPPPMTMLAHGPLLCRVLMASLRNHGSVRRAGLISLCEAMLGRQLNFSCAQASQLPLGYVAPPLQTCASANCCLARVPQGLAREFPRVPLQPWTQLFSSCSVASETVLSILWRALGCKRRVCACGVCSYGRGPSFLTLRVSFLGSSFELEGDLRCFGKPTTVFLSVVSVAGRD